MTTEPIFVEKMAKKLAVGDRLQPAGWERAAAITEVKQKSLPNGKPIVEVSYKRGRHVSFLTSKPNTLVRVRTA